MGIDYPIAVDNDFAVWRAFDNAYWPALYFVDAEGRIRHHHFGEEDYERSERVIQQLLAEAGSADVDDDLVSVEPDGVSLAADWDTLGSPETYVGYARATGFASPGGFEPDRSRVYAEPRRLGLNQWALVRRLDGAAAARDPERARRPDRAPLPRPRRQPRAGRAGGRGPVRFRVRIDGEPPGVAQRARRRRARQRDRLRGAALPADPPGRPRSPTAPSRSPSSTRALRPTCSPSASRRIEPCPPITRHRSGPQAGRSPDGAGGAGQRR